MADVGGELLRHEGLVHFVARCQWLGNLNYAEALQAGRIGLWQALLRYDPARGTAFSTYAWPATARQVWRAVAQAQLPPHNQLAPSPPQPAPDLDEAVDVAQVHNALHALVQRLPAQLHQVIVAYCGLDGSPPSSLRQLAQTWAWSHETVRQRLLAALVWLRHPLYSLGLRQLFERNTFQDYEESVALTRRYPTKRASL